MWWASWAESFPPGAPPSLLPCRQQPCSALKEFVTLYKPFKGNVSGNQWSRIWKPLCQSRWHEEKQGVSTWTWWTRFFFNVNFSASTAHVIILCGLHSRNHFLTCNKSSLKTRQFLSKWLLKLLKDCRAVATVLKQGIHGLWCVLEVINIWNYLRSSGWRMLKNLKYYLV